MNTLIIDNPFTDIYFNLAAEEFLLKTGRRISLCCGRILRPSFSVNTSG